mgnify:FL=1
MSINTAIGLVGVAKQASRTTPAAEPTYLHGLIGGSPFGVTREMEVDPVACGVRANSDSYISKIEVSPSFESRAYADAIGLYLLAALGKDVASETGGNTSHAFSMGPALPYLTVWGQVGTDNFTQASGCKVSELELSFDGNEPLKAKVTLTGIDATMGLESIPGDVDPSCFGGYFVPTDATFLLDMSGDSPAEAIVSKGSVTLANNVTAKYGAGRVMPSEVSEGKLSVSGSVTLLPDDMTPYRAMVTGSKTGTKPSGKPVYGSFSWTFTHSEDASMTLKVEGHRIPFTAEYISVDPSGGDGEVEFSFSEALIDSRDGSPVTVTLVNGVKAY